MLLAVDLPMMMVWCYWLRLAHDGGVVLLAVDLPMMVVWSYWL